MAKPIEISTFARRALQGKPCWRRGAFLMAGVFPCMPRRRKGRGREFDPGRRRCPPLAEVPDCDMMTIDYRFGFSFAAALDIYLIQKGERNYDSK